MSNQRLEEALELLKKHNIYCRGYFIIGIKGQTEQDIVTIASGGNIAGIRQPGTALTGCTDWLRPVIFKVERMGSD